MFTFHEMFHEMVYSGVNKDKWYLENVADVVERDELDGHFTELQKWGQ